MILNYELYNVSSMEWFKKKAIEENRRELNGFELNDFGDEKEMNLFEQIYINQSTINQMDPSAGSASKLMRRNMFVKAMKERLRIVHQLKTHPEIRQINIGSPIFVMGLLRTGTTLLYNLLALDSLSCYPTFDLAINPSLPWSYNSNEQDPRVTFADTLIYQLKDVMINFDKAHYIDTYAPEECTVLFANMGLNYIPIISGKDLMNLKYILDDIDFRQVYEYHHLLVQFLCYKKLGLNFKGHHCLFKCPYHVFHLPSLLEVYNNAKVIITHRDLSEVVPSLASLMEISSNSSYIDRFDYGRKSLQVCGVLSDILLKETGVSNNNQNFIHVSYSELMKNPHQVIKNIYSQCQLNYTEEFDKKITEYLQKNPQGRHGRHTYSLAKYGLSELEIQYRFDSYSKRFLAKKT